MTLTTSVFVQDALLREISQVQADITAYQTTFAAAPRAEETIRLLQHRLEQLENAKEDIRSTPCTV